MTPNGKVDRAALPAPDASNMLRDAPSPEPFTAIEIEVAEIVATLLELESVSRDDNFFLLGGHSLLGTQLITRIRGVFGVEVSLASLFDNPTVRGIAAEIDRLTSAAEEIFLKNESSTSPEAPAP
jgi:acyl carrier protein